MDELIVNGRFLGQSQTGIQRFSWEVLKVLSQETRLKIKVAMPQDTEIPQGEYPNCEFVYVGKMTGNMWEHFSLPHYSKKQKKPLLCMGGVAPFFYSGGYVVLHDTRFKEDFAKDKKSWLFKIRLNVRSFIYRSRRIFTVSDFACERITHFYPKLKKPPKVVYCGYEHIYMAEPEKVEEVSGKFFLSVGTNLPHKNFKYILHLAKNNPDKFFVITGKEQEETRLFLTENNIKNCYFTGYLTDGKLVWLYQNCEGFILPSLYEGFGIPPLEAVAFGCRKIFLSDISVFHEIYGDSAVYFEPTDYQNTVDLSVEQKDEKLFEDLLNKYSWKKTAKIIFDTIFSEKGENN